MIGSNVSTIGGIDNAFVQAKNWEAECIQINTTPSRSWLVQRWSDADIELFHRERKLSGSPVVIAHVPFLVNLASQNPEIRRRSIQRLVVEMQTAEELGIDRVVLHPGSSGDTDVRAGIRRIAEGIAEAFSYLPQCSTNLLLETMAGQGFQLGRTFDQLAAILEFVRGNDRIGICFDTCHAFAAGYDIRGYCGFTKVIDEFDRVLGLRRIGAFHLNDSKHPLGSKVDRHCSIGTGFLGLELFQAIVTDKCFDDIPMILENPNRDHDSLRDLAILKDLRANSQRIVDVPLPDWAAYSQSHVFEDSGRY